MPEKKTEDPRYNIINMVLGTVDTRAKPTLTGNPRRKGGQGIRV